MKPIVLFLLLLSACASPGPTQYGQGIPVAPRAPTFSPITDSPITTGQPGYLGPMEGLPRSPHARVLPQTPETMREPGLWASSAPTSSGDVLVLGVPIPLTSEPSQDPSSAHMRRCALELALLTTGTRPSELDRIIGAESRRCLAATAQRACMDYRYKKGLIERESKSGADRKAVARAVDVFGAATRVAREFYEKSCTEDMIHQIGFPYLRDDIWERWLDKRGGESWWAP